MFKKFSFMILIFSVTAVFSVSAKDAVFPRRIYWWYNADEAIIQSISETEITFLIRKSPYFLKDNIILSFGTENIDTIHFRIGERCMIYYSTIRSLPNKLVFIRSLEKETTIEEKAAFLNIIGVLKGYDDNSFHLEKIITRAEFTTMALRASQKKPDNITETIFKDTENHWAKNEISEAYFQGYIKGYNDTAFRPDDTISYEEMITIVIRILNLEDEAQKNGGFPYGYLSEAEKIGIVYRAQQMDSPNRADAVALLFEIMYHGDFEEDSSSDNNKNFSPLQLSLDQSL